MSLEALERFKESYSLVHYDFEPDNEEKLPLMRRFCDLYSYARLTYCLSEEVPAAPEWMVKLRSMPERKKAFLVRIVAGEA